MLTMQTKAQKVFLLGLPVTGNSAYPPLICFYDEVSKLAQIESHALVVRNIEVYSSENRIRRLAGSVRRLVFLLAELAKLYMTFDAASCDAVIVIDQDAYALSSLFFKKANLILWSHDIVGHDQRLYSGPFTRLTRFLASRALRKKRKLIIQDQERMQLLSKSLRIEDVSLDAFYAPVFLNILSDAKPQILSSSSKPILMQIGGIGSYRFSDELLSHYQDNHRHYRLYLHGFIFREINEQLERCSSRPIVSSERINGSDVWQIVNNADIGFIGYRVGDLNHRYICKASGQFIEFMRCGKPVIVIGPNNLDNFVEENRVGVAIQSLAQLGDALNTIISNYDDFSKNSLLCFKKFFDCSLYVPELVEWACRFH